MLRTLDASDAFREVKPLCVRFLKDTSKESAVILRRALEQLTDDACQELHEYLLMPLMLVLKKEKRETLVAETVASIRVVLEKTRVNDESLFSDIFLQLLFVVSTVKENLQVSSTSEEVKLEVCNALKSLMNCALPRVLLHMYSLDFRLCLSHAVTILLLLAEKERNRKLQIAAMECLGTLACNTVNDVFKSAALFEKAGNAFAGFFPGISIALTRVILDAENRSQKVSAVAFKTWGYVIHICLGDAYLEALCPDDEEAKQKTKMPVVCRNEEWAKSTAEKLCILVDKVLPSLATCEDRVKLAALEWARTLLLRCSRSLEVLAPTILQMVLALSADDSEGVSIQSRSVLDEVSSQMMALDSLSLTEILEEDFHRTLGKFPRVFRMGSEDEKLNLVKLLCGYLRIFRTKIAKILMSPTVCQRLFGILFLVTEFDTGKLNLLAEQATSLDFQDAVNPAINCCRNQFMHFTNMNIYREFTVVCKLLGTYGDIIMLMDTLRNRIEESARHRKQAILVLTNVLRSLTEDTEGGHTSAKLEDSGFIGSLVEHFVSRNLWDLPLTGAGGAENTGGATQQHSLCIIPLDKMNSNILQSCLLLDAVAVLSQLSNNFQPLLRICLCPILEKADSQNYLVSHVACTTLWQVAKACGYSSISELIHHNTDYIANTVLFKLRHPDSHGDVTRIVQALAKHSDKSSAGLLEDVGHEVLNALDFCHKDSALPFLKVLASIVVYLNTWFPAAPKTGGLKNSVTMQMPPATTFRQFVEELHRCKTLSADMEFSDEELENSEAAPQQNVCDVEMDEKPLAPGHIKLLVQVLKRCIHLQSSSNIYIQTAVLSIIKHAVIPMSCYQDELLPAVHLLWKPLVARFQKDNWHLCAKAFEVVGSLAEASRDFIRERTMREVWPRLAEFLHNQHAVSKNKGKAYEITSAFKYQLVLLRQLGPISCQLEVQEQGIDLLASAVVPYLELSQPLKLQEAAVECIEDLARCSADTVWYCMVMAYCTSETYWSPGPPLQPLPLRQTPCSDNSNVLRVMAFLTNLDGQQE